MDYRVNTLFPSVCFASSRLGPKSRLLKMTNIQHKHQYEPSITNNCNNVSPTSISVSGRNKD
jgi:hypothetical protein